MPQSRLKILTSICLLFFVANALSQTVSFPFEPMRSRIERINETANEKEVSITYESRFVQGVSARALTSNSNNAEELLFLSLKNTPLTYRKINSSRLVIVRLPNEESFTGNLAGKITDVFGVPLANATVWVKSLQKGTTAGMNGDYSLSLPTGSYAVEVRFLGFKPICIERVEIMKEQITRLDIALKETNIRLNEVAVTQAPLENTVIGALYAQRNTPYISAVLAAQEINRSAANNVLDALKLIPSVATTENDGLIIRGAGGRWNEVALDGISLPNYDPSFKIFSFDLLPVSLVDNIRLLKSSTSDIPIVFGNAMTEILTKDIPERNFVQLRAEYQFNTQSTFKHQHNRKRGKWDFIGMDNGSREMPISTEPLFSPEHFRIFRQNTPPSQHYSATVGRVRALANKGDRMGLIFSLTFRNVQRQSIIEHTQRGRWKNIGQYTGNMNESRNVGNSYQYNSILGGMLNAGWQFGRNRISFRNIFSQSFENDLTTVSQHLEDIPDNDKNLSRQFFNYPTFSRLLQNKLNGQHAIGNASLNWNVSHTLVRRERKDAAFSEMYKPLRDDSLLYFLHRNSQLKDKFPASSGWYSNREQSFRMGASASFPFHWFSLTGKFTAGYDGSYKQIRYRYGESILHYAQSPASQVYRKFEQNSFQKTMVEHFPFAMVEQRWNEKLRLTYGIRGSYETVAREWSVMPSANVVYMPQNGVNVRMSYRYSVIRPQLADYIPYPVYDTHLLGTSVNRPTRPSSVQAVDFQIEKYIGSHDLLSAGLFFRHINRPIERTTYQFRADERMYVLQNSDKAVNYGIEANARKKLDFITDAVFLRNIQLVAGFMFTRSTVEGKRLVMNDKKEFVEAESTQKRPLTGQMPYLINIGLNYSNKNLNANVIFNRNSRQLFVLGENAHQHEYRAPHNSLEATVSYRFPQNGILLKISGTNLLNTKKNFYTNTPDDYVRDEYNFPTENLLPHKSENFDSGRDPVIHQLKNGRTFTFSVNYNF